jgi:hypothetical protein
MASTKSSSGSAQNKTKSSSAPRAEPTIPNYDAQTADEVTRRLRNLSQADLAKLESYERKGQGRTTVLARIGALRGEAPWSGYDDMEAEEVNDALKKRDGGTARAVLDYERHHKARTTIIEFATRKRDAATGSAPTTSRRNGAGKTGSRARPSQRSTSSEPSSASKSSTRKRTSASSRRGSNDKPPSRSSGAKSGGSSRQRSSSRRSATAAQSRTRASTASRPTAPSAASSRRGKRTQASSRSKSGSSGASRSPSSSRARSSRPGSAKRTRQIAPASARRRMTATARSAGARTEKAAKGAGRAVGAAAKNSRDVLGTAAQDTGHAVGTAAKKAKGPALTAGAVAVALGGGMVLGSKLLPKRTILGIPIPGRRSRLSQAAKSLGKARNGILETGNRIDAISKQVSAVNDGIQELASGTTPPKH